MTGPRIQGLDRAPSGEVKAGSMMMSHPGRGQICAIDGQTAAIAERPQDLEVQGGISAPILMRRHNK